MLATYPFLNTENIGKLTQRQYSILLDQVWNITNFRLGNNLEFYADEKEQQRQIDFEYEMIKQRT